MRPSTSTPEWSERHSTAVREAAPETPAFSTLERVSAWEQVETTAAARTARPRRARWKAAVAGVVALGAIGVAGTATAGVFSAHTGRGPFDAEDIELGGPGERLDPSAPDFAAVIDEVTGDIRFPSEQERETALAWSFDNYTTREPSTVSTGALRLWVAGHALCAWSNSWAVALRAGDATSEEQAAAVILDARTWPSITDTDPDFANESEFAWLPELEGAIRADDPRAARKALRSHQACMPGLAPALGLGKRW